MRNEWTDYVASALVALAALSGSAANADAPPNVVLIIGDDQGWGDYGFMGHGVIQTPHLDRLAAQSVVFEHGYVVTSLCRPSLATLATGLYPHQHGITGNDPQYEAREERPALNLEYVERFKTMPRVAQLLGETGYVSLQTGKWWEGQCTCGGFTEGMTHGDAARGGRHGDEGLKIGRETMQPIFDFIDNAGDSPFFVWYAPFLPHLPHNPPQRLLEKYIAADRPIELARYYAMCEWLDETCGDLFGFLDARGLSENTLVIFLADNGWVQAIGEPSGPFGAPRGKRSPYDGGLRTPIMVRWPGHMTPQRVNVPVSSVDIVPTILAACGVTPREPLPGINLLDGDAVRGRDAVFGAVFAHDMVDIDRPEASLLYRWVVRGEWKLILPRNENVAETEPELYRIVRDPFESRNLFDDRATEAQSLGVLLDAWWRVGP